MSHIVTGTPQDIVRQYQDAIDLLGPLEGETPYQTADRVLEKSNIRFSELCALSSLMKLTKYGEYNYRAMAERITELQSEPRPGIPRLVRDSLKAIDLLRPEDGESPRDTAIRTMNRASRACSELIALKEHLGLSRDAQHTEAVEIVKQYQDAIDLLGPLEGETPCDTAKRVKRLADDAWHANLLKLEIPYAGPKLEVIKSLLKAVEILGPLGAETPEETAQRVVQMANFAYVHGLDTKANSNPPEPEPEHVKHARTLTEHEYWQMRADAAFARQIRKAVTDANRTMTEPP